MSTFPLISHRLYVAAVSPDNKAEVEPNFGRPVPPHPGPLPWGEGERNPGVGNESRIAGETRRDGDILALPPERPERRDQEIAVVPVKVKGDWKVRARGEEAVNSAAKAADVPLEILESRRPMPSGARRLQSTTRAIL